MGPKAPRGGCGSDFRASLDNVPVTFLFYPIAPPKSIHSLPKDLQALSVPEVRKILLDTARPSG